MAHCAYSAGVHLEQSPIASLIATYDAPPIFTTTTLTRPEQPVPTGTNSPQTLYRALYDTKKEEQDI